MTSEFGSAKSSSSVSESSASETVTCLYSSAILIGHGGGNCGLFAGTTLYGGPPSWSGVFYGCGAAVELRMIAPQVFELYVAGAKKYGPTHIPCGGFWGPLQLTDFCQCVGGKYVEINIFIGGIVQ